MKEFKEVGTFFPVKHAVRSLIVPVGLAVFFWAAPRWSEHKIIKQILSSNPGEEAKKFFESVSLRAICGSSDPGFAELKTSLMNENICRDFDWMQVCMWVALGMVILTLLTLMLTTWGAKLAKRSPQGLLTAFANVWRLNYISTFIRLLCEAPLLAYALFLLTTLAFNVYFPKLVFGLAILGVWGTVVGLRALFKKIPIENQEPFGQVIQKHEAPQLWSTVQHAAMRLQTAPPDNILLTLNMGAYVTEVPVTHATGTVTGRTLCLSQPLLEQLSASEMLSIVGHELGHFMGEDTVFTKKFAPKYLSAEHTYAELHKAGIGTLSVRPQLDFCLDMFLAAKRMIGREREFAADQVGSKLAGAFVSASALVKVHLLAEAFDHKAVKEFELQRDLIQQNAMGDEARGATLSLQQAAQDLLSEEKDLLVKLLEQHTWHPFDTHPSLVERLQALHVDPKQYRVETLLEEMAAGELSAQQAWLPKDKALLKEAQIAQESAKVEVQQNLEGQFLDDTTEHGKKRLDELFPPWELKRSYRFSPLAIIGIVGGLLFGTIFGFLALDPGKAEPTLMVALFVFSLCVLGASLWSGMKIKTELLTVTWKELQYSAWTLPVAMSNIQTLQVFENHGVPTQLNINLKEKMPTPTQWKMASNAKQVILPIQIFGKNKFMGGSSEQKKNLDRLATYAFRVKTSMG